MKKDGKKFTLLPLKDGVRPKVPTGNKWTFFTITHSEHEMGATIKKARVVHALVVKSVLNVENEQTLVEYHVEVKEILEEF